MTNATFKLAHPIGQATAYWRLNWAGSTAEQPDAIWYEVDAESAVLRLIDVFADGSLRAAALTDYPDGVTDFAIGSLTGGGFYDLEWSWPQPDELESTLILPAHATEFEALWKTAR